MPAVTEVLELNPSEWPTKHSMSYFLRKNSGVGQSIVTVVPQNAAWQEFDPSEGYRVCRAVTSAIFWSTEMVLRCAAPIFPPCLYCRSTTRRKTATAAQPQRPRRQQRPRPLLPRQHRPCHTIRSQDTRSPCQAPPRLPLHTCHSCLRPRPLAPAAQPLPNPAQQLPGPRPR